MCEFWSVLALSRAAGVGSGSLAPEFTKMLVAVWLVPDEVERYRWG